MREFYDSDSELLNDIRILWGGDRTAPPGTPGAWTIGMVVKQMKQINPGSSAPIWVLLPTTGTLMRIMYSPLITPR